MLTDKQELFAIEIVMNGGNATEAYEKAYDAENMSKQVIYNEASKLKRSHKVSIRIKELRMASFTKSILTIEERKEVLSELALLGSDKAIDLLNKMDGVYDKKTDTDDDTTGITITLNKV